MVKSKSPRGTEKTLMTHLAWYQLPKDKLSRGGGWTKTPRQQAR